MFNLVQQLAPKSENSLKIIFLVI